MSRFVAYLVFEDPTMPGGERYELVDMQGRVLGDKKDMFKWLYKEAPLRPDLAGRRIDVVDADENTSN